ncbi:MAG: 1-acyl-sn-glycerol-3-phosphate acyltransferase, partial [Eggerthellaceae bacterium]|nr:1-acyl-sn-glycerol-3-phosphate acyltransferase [Eggerthellaceae bacterium]
AKYLKDGEIVGIYPEGTRRGRGTVELSLHAGVALIARMGKAPMLPSTVVNVEKIKQKGKLPRFPKVIVRYGQPIYIEQFDFLPKAERLDAASWYVMRECFALDYGCPADQVDMVSLFPKSKDYAATFAEHPLEPVTKP